MSENLPQIAAILRAIEERLTALMDLQIDPEGRVQKAQTDVLYAYGLIAQVGEIQGIQRDQILALSDAISVLVARFVDHDRKVADQHGAILDLLTSVAHGIGLAEIAADAAQARAVLHAEAEERAAELELAADQAQALLKTARMDARSVIRAAVDVAQTEIAAAEQTARAAIKDATEETS